MNPLFFIDFYKVGHVIQYMKGITRVWSNFTPRTTRVAGAQDVVWFGLGYFMQEYLQKRFQEDFFARPLSDLLSEYTDLIRSTLGVNDVKTDHIAELHKLGYLPIKIYSLPEGSIVPLNVPPLVIVNTDPRFFWLPNYLETLLSAVLWKPCTSATTARRFRKLFMHHARRAGETDFSFVDWMGHDFSFRGMGGTEDATSSSMGHLLSFSGTDTVPAILAATKYYSAALTCGGSVPATEHSVMCAGGQEGEFETFKRLITETYPSGIVSIVSDTWDLWRVLTDYIPRLRETILARDGKIVIRPDSGNPVDILCGERGAKDPNVRAGTLQLLSQAMGVINRPNALPLINKAATIYGDSINEDRADQILTRVIDELRLSPYNCVFGIGSFAYQYVTRDTYGWAMKATAVEHDGQIMPIFKKPITDDGGKFSHKGVLAVYEESGRFVCKQEATEQELDNCAYDIVFNNGEILKLDWFETIRGRVRAGL